MLTPVFILDLPSMICPGQSPTVDPPGLRLWTPDFCDSGHPRVTPFCDRRHPLYFMFFSTFFIFYYPNDDPYPTPKQVVTLLNKTELLARKKDLFI